ncbi:MAG: hypothetical protein DRI37_01585 [Chloroflexi bacterium]|nr:MAG: hypothetical protein DRI37_01585 [Chloroflexota bacterium]
MNLGTFGAILRFAMELEEHAAVFYAAAAQTGAEAPFEDFARGARKRLKRLERARREGISEMILESITGLDGDHYLVSPGPGAGAAELPALEEAASCFYRDAAAKLPIREVVRLFERLAREHERQRARLEEE